MDRMTQTPPAGLSAPVSDLDLSDLRRANITRQAEWDPTNAITLAYRGNELAGEVGEACNIVKKLERERLGLRGSRVTVDQLAQELADVVICVDLLAMDAGVDLARAITEKFDATSEKHGLATRLAEITASRASAARAAVPLTGLPSVEIERVLKEHLRVAVECSSKYDADEVDAYIVNWTTAARAIAARQAEAPLASGAPPFDCCPICGGDCAAANPPVLHCPMKEAPPLASGAGQVPGMPHAVCHACGLGYRCMNPKCPNTAPDPSLSWTPKHAPPAQPGERTGVGLSPEDIADECLAPVRKDGVLSDRAYNATRDAIIAAITGNRGLSDAD
jgi:NTP pyrophosphatase (non-canonical NTP hydrolase)